MDTFIPLWQARGVVKILDWAMLKLCSQAKRVAYNTIQYNIRFIKTTIDKTQLAVRGTM